MVKGRARQHKHSDAYRQSLSSIDENQGLLSSDSPGENDDYDTTIWPSGEPESLSTSLNRSPRALCAPRTPRTPNRVQFDLPPIEDEVIAVQGSPPQPYDDAPSGNNSPHAQSTPLLFSHDDQGLASFDHTSRNDDEVLTWAEREHHRPKSDMGSAFMNMANSIMGAGVIGQPYAFRQAGLLAGIILLIVLTIMVDWTIGLIVINSKLSGSSSFQGTVEHCFGRIGLITVTLMQWAFAFGGMVAFGIIVGDTVPHVAIALWPGVVNVPVLRLLISRRMVIIVFVTGVSYPLSLYRDISKLAKASTLAIFGMAIIILTIVSQGMLVPAESRGTLHGSQLTIQEHLFQAASVISFALVCHHNSLLIYDSLKTPTINRFARVTHYSTTVSMIACLLIAVSGFLTFGSLTQGNVLNNFPADNTMVNVARLCFGLNMLTTLPLEAFVCREVILNYWFAGKPFSMRLHVFVTTSLVFSAMILSLMTCDLGVVFEIIGAISACALAYILPPLCYLKLSTRSWRTIPATVSIVFGFVAMTISFAQTMSKIIGHKGKTMTCK